MSGHVHKDYAGAKFGMWLFLFTEVLLFGGLFILYSVYLARYPQEFISAGKELNKWGRRGTRSIGDFGACCNPMNLFFDKQGNLYTAESGLGRIKIYAPDGQLKSLVGYVGTDRFTKGSRLAASCSNMCLAASEDGSRVYVLDFKNNFIRVLARNEPKP